MVSYESVHYILWRRKSISQWQISLMPLLHQLSCSGTASQGCRGQGCAALPAPEVPCPASNDTALLLGSSSSWCCYCFFDNNTHFRLTSHGDIFLPLLLVQHKLLWHPRDGLRQSSVAGLVLQQWTCDPQHCCGHASEFRGTKGNSGALHLPLISSAPASQLHLVPLGLAQFPLARRGMN